MNGGESDAKTGAAPGRGTSGLPSLATRWPLRLEPDAGRVLAALFMPGEDMPGDRSRSTVVIERVLGLSDDEVQATLAEVSARFGGRHRDLHAAFRRNFDAVASRLPNPAALSAPRAQLLGAYFTHEESPEGACLTNPSMVAHPDQSGLGPGELRFVLSARAIGEGHVSRLEFRTGVVGDNLDLAVEAPGCLLVAGQRRPMVYERDVFVAQLAQADGDPEVADLVLDALGPRFDKVALERSVTALDRRILGRQAARETIDRLAWVAANNYEVGFAEDTAIDERVLVPTGPTESHGIEDARFVRFVDEDGGIVYYATYTAYDGTQLAPQLLETEDFRTFRMRQLSGPAAKNKGMALFPRRIAGRYACLSRWDRESNSLSMSDDVLNWGQPTTIQVPRRPWELVQLGNCGAPIETSEGWLVLTHGVGPMRTYAIGAVLLDLDDPCRVIAALSEPLLAPVADERDGYVPNVVYSCGSLLHGETLVLPFGLCDRAIGFAHVSLPLLLDRLLEAGC